MKFNFKKITPIIAGALLLGSTIGFASAADLGSYPSPFVSGGVSDVAVVYGASAAAEDVASAALFTGDLGKLVTSTGSTTSMSGENVKLESASQKLNIGDALTTVRTTQIDASDLPNLLAKKTFQSKDGVSYNYEQTVKLANGLLYNLFKDIDYANNQPSLGVQVAANTEVLNYTLSFTKTLESTATLGRLVDIQDSDITILGKTYRILNAYNATDAGATNAYLELMGGAIVDSLNEGSNKTYTIGTKTYDVSVSNIAADGAALIINGQTTPKMDEGVTYKLSDGTQVGVRTLWYQTNKVSSVEFTIGAEKMTLYQSGQNVKLNDVTVNDLKSYMTMGSNGAKTTITAIKLVWIPSDKRFITKDQSLEMPGLKSMKLSLGDLTTPHTELIQIQNNGDFNIQLKAPIKHGDVTLDILSGNGTTFKSIGARDGLNISTKIGTAQTIVFDRDINNYFVASYESATAADSYVLRATNIQTIDNVNYTDIEEYANGVSTAICTQKKNAETCTIGSVVLTLNAIDPIDRNLSITCDANCRFDRLYTADGLRIYLPVDNVTNTGVGVVNMTAANNQTAFNLVMSEADKNSVLGNGENITASLGWTSSKAEVSAITASQLAAASNLKVEGTNTYINYANSTLGSKFTLDDETQNKATVEYHGGESYGSAFLAAQSATTSTSGGSVFDVAISDNEAIPNNNLIVIGGSAINKVAATMLGVSYPTGGADFTTATTVGPDAAILKLGSNPSYSSKIAVLVAGWEAKDTKAAAKALISKSVTLSGKTSAVLSTVTDVVTLK